MSDAVRTLPTPINLSDFDVGVTLGTGSFGRVRFATHKVAEYAICQQLILRIYFPTTISDQYYFPITVN